MPKRGSGKPRQPSAAGRAILAALASHAGAYLGFDLVGRWQIVDGHGWRSAVRPTRQTVGRLQKDGYLTRADHSVYHISESGRRALASAEASESTTASESAPDVPTAPPAPDATPDGTTEGGR